MIKFLTSEDVITQKFKSPNILLVDLTYIDHQILRRFYFHVSCVMTLCCKGPKTIIDLVSS